MQNLFRNPFRIGGVDGISLNLKIPGKAARVIVEKEVVEREAGVVRRGVEPIGDDLLADVQEAVAVQWFDLAGRHSWPCRREPGITPPPPRAI